MLSVDGSLQDSSKDAGKLINTNVFNGSKLVNIVQVFVGNVDMKKMYGLEKLPDDLQHSAKLIDMLNLISLLTLLPDR